MKKIFSFIFIFALALSQAQSFNGEVFIRDNSNYYLNQVFVTNINDFKTIKTDVYGAFKINAKVGDIIRFTSIVTDRKDIKVTQELLDKQTNFVELKIAYYDIEEVVINRFKPTGNLRKDVTSLKTNDKRIALQKAIGLPTPKGDGLPTQLPAAGFSGGGLTFGLNSIYDLISGEKKKKERLNNYEKMNNSIKEVKQYFGKEYFLSLKIPENLIDNFLQFVYSSDNLSPYVEDNNFSIIAVYIEKYIPIYQKRLKNSYLIEVSK